MNYRKHLEKYVLQNENLKELSKTSDSWPLLKEKIIVYRGHKRSENIRNSNFYSTSKDLDLVYNNFTGESCCIFKINVMPNIKYIDVSKNSKNVDVMTVNIDESDLILDDSFSIPAINLTVNIYDNHGVFDIIKLHQINKTK